MLEVNKQYWFEQMQIIRLACPIASKDLPHQIKKWAWLLPNPERLTLFEAPETDAQRLAIEMASLYSP